ncbi:MAG: peptidoglycan editing factor PgeF [Nitrospiraceae bacterium]|nr:MAG: peptidoglycan editing factor PgeF [Nitrospiraceae bacterium]
MLIAPPNFTSPSVRAFFTTKLFVNNHNHVSEAVEREFNITGDKIYLPVQKHTNRIQVLEDDTAKETADAVVTDRKNIFIGVLIADCVPVLLHDNNTGVIGAVHAGWRGTAGRILKETISVMQDRFGSSPDDISIAIGPSIRQCSYEVDEDVKASVQEATGEGDYYRREGNKYYIDLSSANRMQALSMRIPPRNIWQSGECTFCNPDRFYSYRRSKGSNGRQGGFIGIW